MGKFRFRYTEVDDGKEICTVHTDLKIIALLAPGNCMSQALRKLEEAVKLGHCHR